MDDNIISDNLPIINRDDEWRVVKRRTNMCKVAPLAPLVSISNNHSPRIAAVAKLRPDNLCNVQSPRLPQEYNICDVNHQKDYIRLREVSGIIGFVVNIHDAMNFDIDLQLTKEIKHKYDNVITNEYTYNDLGDSYLTNPNNVMNEPLIPKIGTTYRCRLRGIGIDQLSSKSQSLKFYLTTVDVKQLLDRTDNWISCTLSDIDIYQRLLVDIFVHTIDGCINIRDYLLHKTTSDNTPLFYCYSRE